MEYLLFFVIGFVLCWLITQKPLKINVHHIQENLISEKSEKELQELQEKMLKEDPKNDKLYEEIDKITMEINDIMGGSDRNG